MPRPLPNINQPDPDRVNTAILGPKPGEMKEVSPNLPQPGPHSHFAGNRFLLSFDRWKRSYGEPHVQSGVSPEQLETMYNKYLHTGLSAGLIPPHQGQDEAGFDGGQPTQGSPMVDESGRVPQRMSSVTGIDVAGQMDRNRAEQVSGSNQPEDRTFSHYSQGGTMERYESTFGTFN